MLLHNSPLFRIYFGNAQDKIFLNNLPQSNILNTQPFSKLNKLMQVKRAIFLRQVHGSSGLVVTHDNVSALAPFAVDGDFLITNEPLVGLGVLAGDCLPIIFYDNHKKIVAIAHAGWKGSVQGIATKTIQCMQETFGTNLENLRIFFGPSAKVCCYQVSDDFVQHLEEYPFAEQVIQKHSDARYYFDLPGFNRLQLESIGVKKEAFCFDYNICTICDEKFWSARRQGEQAGRQMTVVSLT